MLQIFESILPIFLLVLLGVALKRSPLLDQGLWPGLETFSFYVLFPALLFLTLAKADFGTLELGAIGVTSILTVFVMFALCFALRPLLAARGIPDSAYTSLFQTATRWNGFVALAIAERYAGTDGLALVALVMAVIIIPINFINVAVLVWYGSGQKDLATFAKKLLTNPLIIGCTAGLLMQAMPFGIYPPIATTIDLLARSALGIGLLLVGAGLRVEDALRPGRLVLLASLLKLIVTPALFVGIGMLFGLSGQTLVLLAICGSVPTAMNGYVLARQMGGDETLYAAVATLQTAASFLTIPAAIALTEFIASR